MSKKKIISLKEKCKKISSWSKKNLKVNLSCYIINEFFFTIGSDNFNSDIIDNCQNMQNILLLDEFYRSAIHLAGKYLLWFILPVEKGYSYLDTKYRYIQNGFIDAKDWIDFGGLDNISSLEFYGGGLWSLYKSTEAIFKSLFKSILVEIYSKQFPKIYFTADIVKHNIQNLDLTINHTTENFAYEKFDSYQLLLTTILEYLKEKEDKRYELIYSCFYLKLRDRIEKIKDNNSWLSKQLLNIKNQNSSLNYLYNDLKNFDSWQIQRIVDFYELMHNSLLHTYNMSRKFLESYKHEFLDWDIANFMQLSMALYKSFYDNHNKITIYRYNNCKKCVEKHLTIVSPENNETGNWLLFVGRYTKLPISDSLQYVRKHPTSYLHLLAWAVFNNVVDENTQFSLHASEFKLFDIKYLINELNNMFLRSKIISYISEYSMYHLSIKKALIVIDVNEAIFDDNLLSLDDNVINFNNKILNRIHIIYSTFWGELICDHINSENIMLDFIRYIHQHIDINNKDPKIKVITSKKDIIAPNLLSYVDNIAYQTVNSKHHNVSHRTYNVKQDSPFKYDILEQFLVKDCIGGEVTSILIPKVIDNYMQLNILQIFMQKKGNKTHLIISHQDNSIEYYVGNINKNKLSKLIYDIYTKSLYTDVSNIPLILFYDVNKQGRYYICKQYNTKY